MKLTFAAALLLVATAAAAHPGSAIAVSKAGTVYFVDTGAGVFAIEAAGRIERREGPAFHWFAFDPESRFRNTPWPSIPGAEFRSAGNVVLSSDYPVTIGRDGRFYYADGRGHIVAIEPSGARSVFATLPPARNVNGLAPAPDGSLLYTEDRAIRKIDARGRVSTIVANMAVPNCAKIPSDEPQNGAYLRGLAVADDGTIYVAAAGCGALMRVDAAGRAGALLRTAPPWSPTAVAVNGRDVYVLEYLHTASDNRREWIPRIRKIGGDGKVSVLGYKR
ncbi:MAG TPA: hypothetical protein VI670_08950 [Thermoanaerobaculia bacterium]|jgi:streptogramin lyase